MERKYKIKIYPLAQQDMDEIFNYISNELNNPLAAIKLINDFEKAFEITLLFPMSWSLINNEYAKDQSLRKIIVNNYIAFYRIKDDEIQIVRVLYAMSNYQELL